MEWRSACKIAGVSFVANFNHYKIVISASNAPNSKQQYKEFIICKNTEMFTNLFCEKKFKNEFAFKMHNTILKFDFSSGTLNKKLRSKFLNDENMKLYATFSSWGRGVKTLRKRLCGSTDIACPFAKTEKGSRVLPRKRMLLQHIHCLRIYAYLLQMINIHNFGQLAKKYSTDVALCVRACYN